jgi:hypothetical protein
MINEKLCLQNNFAVALGNFLMDNIKTTVEEE